MTANFADCGALPNSSPNARQLAQGCHSGLACSAQGAGQNKARRLEVRILIDLSRFIEFCALEPEGVDAFEHAAIYAHLKKGIDTDSE